MLFTKKSVLLGDQPLKTILTEHHFFGRPPRLTGSSFFICGPRLQMSLPLLSLRQSVFTFLIRGRGFLNPIPTPPELADFALPFLRTGTVPGSLCGRTSVLGQVQYLCVNKSVPPHRGQPPHLPADPGWLAAPISPSRPASGFLEAGSR